MLPVGEKGWSGGGGEMEALSSPAGQTLTQLPQKEGWKGDLKQH